MAENEGLPAQLGAYAHALSGLVAVCAEVLTFWKDGNPQTTLAAIEKALEEIESNEGHHVWASGKHLPPYVLEEILRLRVIMAAKASKWELIFHIVGDGEKIQLCCFPGDVSSARAGSSAGPGPSIASNKAAVQYRLFEQALKTLAAILETPEAMLQAISSLCKPFVPELQHSRARAPARAASSGRVFSIGVKLFALVPAWFWPSLGLLRVFLEPSTCGRPHVAPIGCQSGFPDFSLASGPHI